MSFGGGGGNLPGQSGGMLASAADREAAQAVLKQAFEDERLTQDEFESRIGRAVAARTQGELFQLTRDLPAIAPAWTPTLPGPPRRRGLIWVPAAVIAVVVIAVAGLVVTHVSTSGTSQSAAPVEQGQPNPGPAGPGQCPVDTSRTAVAIANDLARDPVYTDSSSLLTAGQAGRLRSEIARVDRGRIRIAAVTPATVRRGGGQRALANAIAGCQADAAGTTLLTTSGATYVVTSYTDDKAATSAVGAALNTHASLAAGLLDAVRRVAVVDKHSH